MSSELETCHIQSVSTGPAWIFESLDISLYNDLEVDASLIGKAESAVGTQLTDLDMTLQHPVCEKSLPFPSISAGGRALEADISSGSDAARIETTEEGQGISLDDIDVSDFLRLQPDCNLSEQPCHGYSPSCCSENQGLGDARAQAPLVVSSGKYAVPDARNSRDYPCSRGVTAVTKTMDLLPDQLQAALKSNTDSPDACLFGTLGNEKFYIELHPQLQRVKHKQKCSMGSPTDIRPVTTPSDPFTTRRHKPIMEVTRQPPKVCIQTDLFEHRQTSPTCIAVFPRPIQQGNEQHT